MDPSPRPLPLRRPMGLISTTTVARSAEEVHGPWRRVDRLPTSLAHLDEVRLTGLRTSHWRAGARSGARVEALTTSPPVAGAHRQACRRAPAPVGSAAQCPHQPTDAGVGHRGTGHPRPGHDDRVDDVVPGVTAPSP